MSYREDVDRILYNEKYDLLRSLGDQIYLFRLSICLNAGEEWRILQDNVETALPIENEAVNSDVTLHAYIEILVLKLLVRISETLITFLLTESKR